MTTYSETDYSGIGNISGKSRDNLTEEHPHVAHAAWYGVGTG